MERRLVVMPRKRGPSLYLTVWLAQSPEEQRQGLGGAEGLDPRGGMLFPLPHGSRTAVTLKPMRFALDVLFLSPELRILETALSAPVGSIVQPTRPYAYLLELLGGTVAREGVDLTRPVSVSPVEA